MKLLSTSVAVLIIGCCDFIIASTSRAGEAGAARSAEWNKILQAAKKEGQVTIYASAVYEQVFREFQKRFPDIRVVAVTGSGNEIGSRIMSERRARKYLADLYIGGTGTGHDVLHKAGALDPIQPVLLLPEVLDPTAWFQRRHHYVDADGRYILAFNGIVQNYFAYNTKLVNAREFNSYWDFLNPKWRGRIVVSDPSMRVGVTGALRLIYYTEGLGEGFLRRFLAEMALTPTRDLRQLVDWLAAGKFAISAFASADRANIMDAKTKGLPVDWFDPTLFKEGVPGIFSSNGNLALIHRAAHPNAAIVAANWLLSREGQKAYQELQDGADSLRIDISKDNVPPHTRRKTGSNYELMDRPDRMDMDPIYKIVGDVWKGR
jgi:iron(III) transport system substrate-binding protein